MPTPLTADTNNDLSCKPFLRWAGGKSWFIKHFLDLISSKSFFNYHEPFLGGASVFFNLNPENNSFLSDTNAELIDTYLALKDDAEKIIHELGSFTNNKTEYYKLRDAKFRNAYKKAARFIFLNKTSFNGIYRVNLQGKYNVPYGHRQMTIFEPENLRHIHRILQKAKVDASDFDIIRTNLKSRDLVFLDPPYTINHNNNGFIRYNQKLFSLEDQHRLSDLIDYIKRKNAYYILTNAAHHKIEEIFDKGDKKLKLKRPSSIAANPANRGNYEEVIYSNI